MKKRYVVLSVVCLLVATLCIWQRNNIKALIIFATSDRAHTEALIEKNKEELDEALKKHSDSVPRPLTKEEEDMIASGELSVEEAVNLLLAEDGSSSSSEKSEEERNLAASSKPTENPSASPSAPSSPAPSVADDKKSKENAIIKRYTAELYSMKAYYIGQLNQIESRARSEFSSMSDAEKKNLSKAAFVAKYAGYATSLLGECDGKVSALLSEMKSELSAVDGDMSIISTIKQAYESEKAARKAYYLNMVS